MSQTHSNYPPPHAPASRLSVAERSRSGSPKYCEIDLKLLWRPNPPKNRPERSHQCRPSPAQLRERWRALQGKPGSQCSLSGIRESEQEGRGEERAGDTTGWEASPPKRERESSKSHWTSLRGAQSSPPQSESLGIPLRGSWGRPRAGKPRPDGGRGSPSLTLLGFPDWPTHFPPQALLPPFQLTSFLFNTHLTRPPPDGPHR